MLIDGVKYACEACKRGHRVSECNHSDRPLIVIPKKGRPPSQCPHCRTLRKSRSAHVKCACGDKTKGGCHKQPVASAADQPHDGQLGAPEHHPSCACRTGDRCSCSLKKDHLLDVDGDEMSPSLDTIPEFIENGDTSSASLSPFHDPSEDAALAANGGFKIPAKPQLIQHKSDGSVHSINGHHKPLHHHQHTGVHKYQPYSISKAHHGVHTHHHHAANRSVDSLPAAMQLLMAQQFAEQRHPLEESIKSAQEDKRLIRSEHNSPVLQPQPGTNFAPQQMLPQPLVRDESNLWMPDFDTDFSLQNTEVFEPNFGNAEFVYPDNSSFISATPTDDASTFASFDLGSLQDTTWPGSLDETSSFMQRSSVGSFNAMPRISYPPVDTFDGGEAQRDVRQSVDSSQAWLQPYTQVDAAQGVSDDPSSSASSIHLSRGSSTSLHAEQPPLQQAPTSAPAYATEVDEIETFLAAFPSSGLADNQPGETDWVQSEGHSDGYVIGF